MTVIMTHKLGSKSAKSLSRSLGIRRVRSNGTFRNNYNHKVINWGSSMMPEFPIQQGIINHPSAVANAVNKLKTLELLTAEGVPTLTYHTTAESALTASMNGKVLFARKLLTSNSGRGIVVIQPDDQITYAPLYTEFFDKVTEYRVHATKTETFDYQAKLKRRGEDADPYVFNYDSGRVFCRQGIELPDLVRDMSMKAIRALGLDFGAVDIGVDADGNVAVFEVNSGPALEGTTLDRYVDILNTLIRG